MPESRDKKGRHPGRRRAVVRLLVHNLVKRGRVAAKVAAALDRRTSSPRARPKKRAAATGEHKTRRGGSGGEQP